MEGEADAYGGGIVDVWFLHLIALHRPVSLSMSLTLSIKAAHLNQRSAPVKRRKAEEGRIITLELRLADTKQFACACCSQ